jgi:cell division protein FtsB
MCAAILTNMSLPSYDSQFGTTRLLLILGFCVVAYMLYNLTVSIYDSYQIEQHISDFEQKNAELAKENQKKLEDFQYYTSKQYIEKAAKQNLGLINPGEKVIILPEEDLIVYSEEEEAQTLTQEIRASWSNPKKWWKWFFSANPYKA